MRKRGGAEPAGDAATRIPFSEIAVFLVPGLAFDPRSGARLGRGKGFYDRALRQAQPGARFVGVAYDRQLAEVPTEPHDIPVHGIVTESGLKWIS